jgi:hypothetical protein
MRGRRALPCRRIFVVTNRSDRGSMARKSARDVIARERRRRGRVASEPPSSPNAVAAGGSPRQAARTCGWCGDPIEVKPRGRIPKWCSPACRQRAVGAGSRGGAGRSAVQVVERLVEVQVERDRVPLHGENGQASCASSPSSSAPAGCPPAICPRSTLHSRPSSTLMPASLPVTPATGRLAPDSLISHHQICATRLASFEAPFRRDDKNGMNGRPIVGPRALHWRGNSERDAACVIHPSMAWRVRGSAESISPTRAASTSSWMRPASRRAPTKRKSFLRAATSLAGRGRGHRGTGRFGR